MSLEGCRRCLKMIVNDHRPENGIEKTVGVRTQSRKETKKSECLLCCDDDHEPSLQLDGMRPT